MAALATASDTFTPTGWTTAKVNGTTYSPGHSLPNSVNYTTNGAQSTSACGEGRVRYAGQSGTTSAAVAALFTAGYRVSTTQTVPSGGTAVITGTSNAGANAGANVFVSGYAGTGIGIAGPAGGVEASRSTLGQTEPPDKTAAGAFIIRVPASKFSSGSAPFTVNMVPLAASAAVSGSGNGGGGSGGSAMNALVEKAAGAERLPEPSDAVDAGSSALLSADSLATATSLAAQVATRVASSSSGGGGYSVTPNKLVCKSSGGPGYANFYVQSYLSQVRVQVYGTVKMQDAWVQSNDCPLGVDIDPDAGYTPGTYDVYLSAVGSLRKHLTLTIDANGYVTLNSPNVTLKMGDLDGDNTVSQAEVDYVHSQIGADVSANPIGTIVPGQPSGPYYPYMADLDGDGQVTQADYSLALASLGQSGD